MSIREYVDRTPTAQTPTERIEAPATAIADALGHPARMEAVQFVHLGSERGVLCSDLTDFVAARLEIEDAAALREALVEHHLRILHDVGAIQWARYDCEEIRSPAETEYIQTTKETAAFVEVAELLFEVSAWEGESDE